LKILTPLTVLLAASSVVAKGEPKRCNLHDLEAAGQRVLTQQAHARQLLTDYFETGVGIHQAIEASKSVQLSFDNYNELKKPCNKILTPVNKWQARQIHQALKAEQSKADSKAKVFAPSKEDKKLFKEREQKFLAALDENGVAKVERQRTQRTKGRKAAALKRQAREL